jgi:hypothetical protein
MKMKKKQKENFNLQLKRGFITVILGLLLSISSPQLMYAKNAITPQLTEDVRVLFDREKQLFNARKNVDWGKMHSFQHPDFRKKISVDEMRYFEGWAAADYREKAKQNAHISGAYVPSVDYMKKNIYKKDPLGFPVERRYEWSGDPYLKIKAFSLEKISISTDGKYAKVKVMLKGRQRLNPAVTRGGDYEFAAQYPTTDYWEKVNGNWVITLLSKPANLSGTGILKFFVPNNKSGWGKAEFVEINPAGLKLP